MRKSQHIWSCVALLQLQSVNANTNSVLLLLYTIIALHNIFYFHRSCFLHFAFCILHFAFCILYRRRVGGGRRPVPVMELTKSRGTPFLSPTTLHNHPYVQKTLHNHYFRPKTPFADKKDALGVFCEDKMEEVAWSIIQSNMLRLISNVSPFTSTTKYWQILCFQN